MSNSESSSPARKRTLREEIRYRHAYYKAMLDRAKKGKEHARDHGAEDNEQKKQRLLEGPVKTIDGLFQEMMEECKGRGFVYAILQEDGTFVSGASDNLKDWWKEKLHHYHPQGNDTASSSKKDGSPIP